MSKSLATKSSGRAAKETTRPYMVRLYKCHRDIIKKSARKLEITDSEFVRRALEAASL